ncbi:hypothetical protein [Actinoplanes sp. HUAS TT8]|uniref:hypothetical protein n=1 Tax=Actinoplanes sp. HUAS TT8 TaxID=3447453 RepID=UPI003F51D735
MSYARYGKTIEQMAAEIRTINIEKGWRTADGGPGTNTFGDYIALLHSELSEALEAYRDHRLADATQPRQEIWTRPEMCQPAIFQGYSKPKPEGVGSEFADVLIRLLDVCDVFGIDLAAEYDRKIAYNRTRSYQHGGRTLADAA